MLATGKTMRALIPVGSLCSTCARSALGRCGSAAARQHESLHAPQGHHAGPRRPDVAAAAAVCPLRPVASDASAHFSSTSDHAAAGAGDFRAVAESARASATPPVGPRLAALQSFRSPRSPRPLILARRGTFPWPRQFRTSRRGHIRDHEHQQPRRDCFFFWWVTRGVEILAPMALESQDQ